MQDKIIIKFHAEKKYGTVSEVGIHLLRPEQRDIDDALDAIARDGFGTVHLYKDAWADLKAWTEPDSYMGPQHWGYVGVYGRHRDSDLLTNANYEAIHDALKEVCKDGAYATRNEDGTIDEYAWLEVVGARHWAVGWVESIMVHWTWVEALDKAAEIKACLEEYAVFDDSAYSEADHAYKVECMDQYADQWKENVLKYLGRDPDARFGTKREWAAVLWALYDEECGYHGTEQAYIDVDDLQRLAGTCELMQLTKGDRPNKVAKAIMQRAGVAA